jgi:hypothetical protein
MRGQRDAGLCDICYRGEGIRRGNLLPVGEGKDERTKGGKLFPQKERDRV